MSTEMKVLIAISVFTMCATAMSMVCMLLTIIVMLVK